MHLYHTKSDVRVHDRGIFSEKSSKQKVSKQVAREQKDKHSHSDCGLGDHEARGHVSTGRVKFSNETEKDEPRDFRSAVAVGGEGFGRSGTKVAASNVSLL